MTAPFGHGYTDYGRRMASADKIYADLQVPVINGTTFYGPFFVGDMPYVGVSLQVQVNNIEAQVIFYTDNTVTTEISRFTFDVRLNGSVDITVPIRGPFMQLRVIPSAAATAFTGKLTSAHTPSQGTGSIPITNVLTSGTALAVGAGATVTRDTSRVRPGLAIWNVFSALATWTASADSIDAFGALTRLDTIDNTNGKTSRTLILPNTPIRISFTNTTGAAGTFNTALLGSTMSPID